jgi:hypothetical protein
LCLKIQERRESLLSLPKFDVIELRAAASPAPSGVDRVMVALQRLAHNGSAADVNVPPR